MNQAYLLSGLPGSGKSTFANAQAKKNPKLVIISADAIGQMLKGDYAIFSAEENFRPIRALTAKIAQEAVKQAIDSGYDLIIDETLLTREAREKWVRFIHAYTFMTLKDYTVVLVEFPNITSKQSLKNRMKYPKGVSRASWKKIIDGMAGKKQAITSEEFSEYRLFMRNRIDFAAFQNQQDILEIV
jgi:predicted kinase